VASGSSACDSRLASRAGAFVSWRNSEGTVETEAEGVNDDAADDDTNYEVNMLMKTRRPMQMDFRWVVFLAVTAGRL
jgi:hypothetical protein